MTTLPQLLITDVYDAADILEDRVSCSSFGAVMSFGSPGSAAPPLKLFNGPTLRMEFDDVEVEVGSHPTRKHVREIIKFCRQVPDDAKVLIHCHAGISRSTAAGMILLAVKMGPGQEKQILPLIHRVRECADPNRLMIRYADDLLGLNGDLLAALTSWMYIRRIRESAPW